MQIYTKEIIKRVTEETEVNKHDVEHVIKWLLYEIENQLLKWNKVIFKKYFSLCVEESKYKSRYSKKFKTHVKVKNKYRIKTSASYYFNNKINFFYNNIKKRSTNQ